MTVEQKLDLERLKLQAPKHNDKAFQALGWMLEECIHLSDEGVDLRAIPIATTLSRARKELGLDEPLTEIPAPPDCDYAAKMLLAAENYLKTHDAQFAVYADNAERAQKIVDVWPQWKRDYAKTAFGFHSEDQSPTSVLHDITAERERQDAKWGGAEHDDQKSPNDFIQHIQDYAGWARVMAGMGSVEKLRKRLIQVAALAVAAVEALDRATAKEKPNE